MVFSDNGGAFEGTNNLLTKLEEDPVVANWLSSHKIKWRFSASLAPWWGGFWERMVRTTKELLRKGLGSASLSYDQLITAVKEVESIVNARPLTYVPADQNEPYVLTPTQLITGRKPNDTYEKSPSLSEVTKSGKETLLKWDRQRLKTMNAWWRAWTTEYLQDLKKFHCSRKKLHEPKLNQAVLVVDDKIKRFYWNLGLITALHPGKDGKIRSVSIRFPTGIETTRDVQKLIPLEVEDPEHLTTSDTATPIRLLDIRVPTNRSKPNSRKKMEGACDASNSTQKESPQNQGDSAGEHVGNITQQTTSRGRRVKLPPRYRT